MKNYILMIQRGIYYGSFYFVRYIWEFVKSEFVISEFTCSCFDVMITIHSYLSTYIYSWAIMKHHTRFLTTECARTQVVQGGGEWCYLTVTQAILTQPTTCLMLQPVSVDSVILITQVVRTLEDNKHTLLEQFKN